jgi:hypothetical protein
LLLVEKNRHSIRQKLSLLRLFPFLNLQKFIFALLSAVESIF